ncbi:transmembrane protein, putative (macronuclear) [Tetrahymena thermophila SB210]|uniref:Transmembrane protein, putative n=1 Tax=Tetrahymena thermophila (strain SB210) TaxID=312017 RepID=Q22GY7_TETTS|nr:transmembrane protein, putative [Tetrahymena thermophila SB210]EAR84537.2 transmembrane protein, putative [Tetrahymena thermophila SB210]|eukprot:XP_001032200.2 transmembrane protein, putative [Tetrahymena thermophila SB210]
MNQRLRHQRFNIHFTHIILVILISQDICYGQNLDQFFHQSNNLQEHNYDDRNYFNLYQTYNNKHSSKIQRKSSLTQKCYKIKTFSLSESQDKGESQECFLNNNNILQLLKAKDIIMLNIKNMENQLLFQTSLLVSMAKNGTLNSFITENYAIFYYKNSSQLEFLQFNASNSNQSSFQKIQQQVLDFQHGTYKIGNFHIRLIFFEYQKYQINIKNNNENYSQKQILSSCRQLLIEEIQRNQLTIYQLDSKQFTIIYNSKIQSIYQNQFIILETYYQLYDIINLNNKINQHISLFSLAQMRQIALLNKDRQQNLINLKNDGRLLENLVDNQVCHQTVFFSYQKTLQDKINLVIVFDNYLQQIRLLEETSSLFFDSVYYELNSINKIFLNQNQVIILKNNNQFEFIEIIDFKLFMIQNRNKTSIQFSESIDFNKNGYFCLNLKKQQQQQTQSTINFKNYTNQIIKSTSFIYQIIEVNKQSNTACRNKYRVHNVIDNQIYDVCNDCIKINYPLDYYQKNNSYGCLKMNQVQAENFQKSQQLIIENTTENRVLRNKNEENEQNDVKNQNQQQINNSNYKEQSNFEVYSDFVNSNIFVIKLDKKLYQEFQGQKNNQNNNFFQIKLNQNNLKDSQLIVSETDKGDIEIHILLDNFVLNPLIDIEINQKYTNGSNIQVGFTLPIIAPQQSAYLEFSAVIISFFTKILYFLNFLAIFIGQFSGYLINIEILQYISLLSYSKSLQNPLSISMSKYLSLFNCNWSYQNQYQLINLNKTESVKVIIFGFQTKLHSSDQQFLLYKGYYSQSFLYLGYTSIILLGIVFATYKIIKFIRSRRNKERQEICFYRILRVIQIELESDVIGNIIQLTFIQLIFSAISQIASFCRLIDFQSKLQQIQFVLSILIIIYATTVIKNLFMMRSLIILDMDRSVKSVWKTFFQNIRETDFSRQKLTAYPIMIAFRKIALAMVAVLLYDYPFTQIYIIFAISLVCSLVSIFKLQGPFQETILNYYMSIQELIMLIIIGCHINYVFCYDELLNQSQNEIYSNDQLVNKIETTVIIEVISISVIMLLNLFIVLTFLKKNLPCFNKKQETNTAINQDDLLMIGNNEKYYLLSQVDAKAENQKKQAKSHTLSDEESLNPQEMVASKQQINQQLQDGGIEFNQNELNFYKDKPIFQQDKQSDAFTPRKLNQSNKSFISNMVELEASNNKILFDDHLPKTAKNFSNTNNNISLIYLGEINQPDEQKSQVNLVDDETFIRPPQNYEINDVSLNEGNQTFLNQNDKLKRVKQKLSLCNTSINYLQNLLNNYNVSTHNIQDQLNVLNDYEEPDSTNRNQLTTDSLTQDQIHEEEKLITFCYDNGQNQSINTKEELEFIQI